MLVLTLHRLHINLKREVINSDNDHFGAAIMGLALAGVLLTLGSQYNDDKHWFSALGEMLKCFKIVSV